MKSWLILPIILLAATTAFSAETSDILGLWKTEKGDVHLEFYPCDEEICGKIVWLKEPVYLDSKEGPVGAAKVDQKNPDPALRNRPLLGLEVMKHVTPAGKDMWEGGACYDPQSGKSYRCKMKLAAPDRLEMRGFVGISLFGRDYVLVR